MSARWRASCWTRSSARRVQVLADIDSTAPIDDRTRASLSLQGVTGLLFVDLEAGSESRIDGAPWNRVSAIP